MDLSLTPEQKALRQTARDFVDKHITPIAMERDRIPDPAEAFPWEVIEEGDKLGLRLLSLPKAYGGGEADILTLCLVGEELARGDLGLAVAFDQTWKMFSLMTGSMTDDQRERHLPGLINNPRALLATANSEPLSGSDNILPYDAPGVGTQTSAVREGDHYVINGRKHFISNGGLASFYVLYARTDNTVGVSQGLTAFLLPADTPGFSVARVHDKMGQRLVQNAELVLENVRVPVEDRLGEENRAMFMRRHWLLGSNTQAAATVLGCAVAAYEYALDWAKTRIQGGRPIIEHPNIACVASDMYKDLEAARSFIWRTAWAAQHDPDFKPKLSNMCKVFASEAATRVCLSALDVMGGHGYMKDHPVEKYIRDALSFHHSDGQNQVIRLRTAPML